MAIHFILDNKTPKKYLCNRAYYIKEEKTTKIIKEVNYNKCFNDIILWILFK